jgi:hypothetical protein
VEHLKIVNRESAAHSACAAIPIRIVHQRGGVLAAQAEDASY